MNAADKRALETAARQFGAVSQDQLHEAGLSTKQIHDRVKDGLLLRFGPRSLAYGASANTFERRAKCALLEFPGSGLSSETSAAYYGISSFQLEPVHVSVPRGTRPRRVALDVVVHRPLFLPDHHLSEVNGLMFTTPTRTGADVANLPHVSAERAARVVESLWAARLTDRQRLRRMADEWCERGRKGSAFLHEFLEERPVEWLPPESNLERRFVSIVTEAGMPRPRSQVNSGSDEDWFGRVDLLDPELPLIAEIDSDRYHTAPLDQAADGRRDGKAKRAGFEVERFTEFEVWHQPWVVVERWANARRRVRNSLPTAGT